MKPMTIQFYLPDGEPQGLKIAEITNRTVQGILIPRTRLKEVLRSIPELAQVAVYFLLGQGEDEARPRVYVGESEDVPVRLKDHNANKDFWQTAVVFISSTNGFTKAHIKFFEWHFIQKAREVGRCDLDNENTPKEPTLLKPMQADCDDFSETITILLGSLGFPILEEAKKARGRDLFFCTRRGAKASGSLTDEGFVVYKGSRAAADMTPSGRKWTGHVRKRLIDAGVLVKEDGNLVFAEDYTFRTPSGASDVVIGSPSNGWDGWKNKDGRTLNEVKRKS